MLPTGIAILSIEYLVWHINIGTGIVLQYSGVGFGFGFRFFIDAEFGIHVGIPVGVDLL